MKIQDQHFYTFNWNEFVHLEFLRALMRLVPEFDLSTFDDIQTVEKVSVTTDENNENPLEISYISKSGEEKTLHIAPEITKRVHELISERIKINDGNGDAQDWKTITFDWNSENEGEFESVKPLEISFVTDTDAYKFAVPQIILRSPENGTTIPRAITFDNDTITIYSTADENGLTGKFQYDLSLYLTKEEAKQVYATIEALNEFKDEVAKTYATQASLTELSTMLQNMIYEKVNDLTSEQDQIKRSVNTLSGDVENLKGETTQLNADNDVLKADVKNLKDETTQLNSDVTVLNDAKNKIDIRFPALSNENSTQSDASNDTEITLEPKTEILNVGSTDNDQKILTKIHLSEDENIECKKIFVTNWNNVLIKNGGTAQQHENDVIVCPDEQDYQMKASEMVELVRHKNCWFLLS